MFFLFFLKLGLLKDDSDQLSLSIPTIFGAALGPFICDMGGRKWGLLVSDILFIVGLYGVLFNEIAGNLITGVAIGMATFSFPLYISEKTPSQLHPPFIGLMGLWMTVGIYAATFLDPDSRVRITYLLKKIINKKQNIEKVFFKILCFIFSGLYLCSLWSFNCAYFSVLFSCSLERISSVSSEQCKYLSTTFFIIINFEHVIYIYIFSKVIFEPLIEKRDLFSGFVAKNSI